MKKQLLVCAAFAATALSVLAQGSLTPPGAPDPTMKTLQQVEPRTDLATVAGDGTCHHVINQPGSYYLSGNLAVTNASGIHINAPGVTLDLNGFEISRASGSSGHGVYINDKAVTVHNGTIVGFSHGILDNVGANRFEKLVALECSTYGIYAGSGTQIIDCRAIENTGTGIYAGSDSSLNGCTASYNNVGIVCGEGAQMSDCHADHCVYDGFQLGSGSRMERCSSRYNGDDGIQAAASTVVQSTVEYNAYGIYSPATGMDVRECSVSQNTDIGIYVSSGSLVVNNRCQGNSTGIQVWGNNSRIEGNHITDGTASGLRIGGSDNYVADNTVMNNVDNYNIAAGNQLNLLICQIPETLDWPCSVKLAGTLTCSATATHGITVNANDVTIDMAGHTLIGPAASSKDGISQDSSYRNLTVRNGKVVGWSGYGIFAYGDFANISDIQASTNTSGFFINNNSTIRGCMGSDNISDGIRAVDGNTISGCTAKNNGHYGIYTFEGCTISGCTANNNGYDGINTEKGSTISGCTAQNNHFNGISTFGSRINNCATQYNNYSGISVYGGSTLDNCAANYNSGNGIWIGSDSRVTDCECFNNGYSGGDGAGIHANGNDNRIEGNNMTDNDRGIDVDGIHNLIVRNSASYNGTNYVIGTDNCVGPIVLAPLSGAISGDTGGIGVGSTDPWANFSF